MDTRIDPQSQRPGSLPDARFAITVEFDVAAEAHAEFLRLVLENAAETLRGEPGCRRFDVLSPEGDGPDASVLLYEVYDDRSAFEAHLETSHYATFTLATERMVRRKTVKEFQVCEGPRRGR